MDEILTDPFFNMKLALQVSSTCIGYKQTNTTQTNVKYFLSVPIL
jgi:hypothetical protein